MEPTPLLLQGRANAQAATHCSSGEKQWPGMGLQSDTIIGQYPGEPRKWHAAPGGINRQGPPYCTSLLDKLFTDYSPSDLREDTCSWGWVFNCAKGRSVSMGHYHIYDDFKHSTKQTHTLPHAKTDLVSSVRTTRWANISLLSRMTPRDQWGHMIAVVSRELKLLPFEESSVPLGHCHV